MLIRTPSMVLRARGEMPVDSGWFWSSLICKSQFQAGLLEGQGVGHPLAAGRAAHRHRSGGAVKVVAPEVQVRLQLVEIGQHPGIAPLVIAPLGPPVVIVGDAPVHHLPVHRAGAAGGLAPGDD